MKRLRGKRRVQMLSIDARPFFERWFILAECWLPLAPCPRFFPLALPPLRQSSL